LERWLGCFDIHLSMLSLWRSWPGRPSCPGGCSAMRPPPLAIRASARFEQRVRDLWLSATGAVLNGGRWPRTENAGPGILFPGGIAPAPKIAARAKHDCLTGEPKASFLSFARHVQIV
jgi:hypothetical protein